MDIRFVDHPSFHRAAVGMVGASAALGLALHPATAMAPLVGGVAGIAIGAALGYGKAAWRLALAGAAVAALFALPPTWTSGAVVASVLGVAIAVSGPRGPRGALAVMLGAGAVVLAMWSAQRVGQAQQTQAWTPWLRDLAASAAMGMVGVFAVLPRHLQLALDPVTSAHRRLPARLDTDVRELCARSLAIWSETRDRLGDADPGRTLVRDGVLKAFEVAMRSVELDEHGAASPAIERRVRELDARIAAATDPEVAAQYRSARAALDDQRRFREHIRRDRERLVARLHNHVAALEKFQLAASGLAAARAASAGAAAVSQLAELSADVAASGEALAELELEGLASPVPASPAPASPAPASPAPDEALAPG